MALSQDPTKKYLQTRATGYPSTDLERLYRSSSPFGRRSSSSVVKTRNKHIASPLVVRSLSKKKVAKMSKKFDKLLERATAPTLLEPDWEGILNCVDVIRSADVPVKPAVASLKKRYHSENPHVALYALMVLEAAVKNCGEKVYKEIATKEFMEDLKHLAMESGEKVKEKVLELIQCWAHAFRNKSEYKIVLDTHNLMKLEGFEFPALRESDAMFSAESAPDWVDGDNCYRCRASFGMLTRKHHCRACGQIFCDKCSSKNMLLPNIGIEKEVRVCESCYEKNKSKQSGSPKKEKKDSEESSPSRSKGAASGTAGPSAAKDKEIKDREEEELAMAIALSQSEADEKERQRQRQLMQLYNGPDSNEASADEFYPPKKKESASILGYKGAMETTANGFDSKTSDYKIVNQPPPTNTSTLDSTDPELARYLNRAYWETRRTEQKQGILRQSPTPSAPPPSESSISNAASVLNDQQASSANGIAGTSLKSAAMDHMSSVAAPPPGTDVFALQNGDISVEDTGRFAAALKNQVEVFVNRIRSNQARGRSIVNDSSIQTLFLSLTNLHSDLLNRMNNLDEKRGYFESLQDRLANIQEARQAVEALREEHEKRRQEEILEAQRRRQIQMQQKLEVMRHKKHEMLEHQRMMALQRMQQQEQEMQMKRQMAAMGIAGTGVMGVQQMMVAQPPGAVQPAVIPQQQMTGYGPPQQWLPQQQQPQQMIHSQLGSGGQPQAASNYEVNPQAQMIGQYNIPAHPPASFPPAPIPQAQPVSVGYFGQTQQEISQSPIPGYHPGVPIVTSAVQPTYVYQQPAPVLPQMMGPVMGQEMQQTHTMVGGQQPAQQIYQGSPAHYPSPSPQVQKEEKHEEELLISFD